MACSFNCCRSKMNDFRVAGSHVQGWARDVNDRDVWPRQPRRDVCRSRDVTETLKCTFIAINAECYLNKLTCRPHYTVAILSPRVRLFRGRYTARTRLCTRPSARSCTRSCTLLCTGRKHGRALRAVYTAVCVTGRLHGPVHGTAVYTTVYGPCRLNNN